MERTHAQDLARYAEGWTIEKVEASDRTECWWKLTLKNRGATRVIHLAATELGAWVIPIEGDGGYLDFDKMVEDMTDHLVSLDPEVTEGKSFIPVDDPNTMSIGFQCPVTERIFRCHLSALTWSTFKDRLHTPKDRRQFASDVWNMKGIW